MYKITIKNLNLFGYHGVKESEKENGQNFRFNVEIIMDSEKYKDTDNLEDAINYSTAIEIIKNINASQRFNLLETLSRVIAKKIMKMSPLVERVSIKIEKTSPPIKENIESVGVEYVADRENLKECYKTNDGGGSRERELGTDVAGADKSGASEPIINEFIIRKKGINEREAGKLKTGSMETGRAETGNVDVYMSLGSNIGDRENNLRKAVELISRKPDIEILSISSIYETEPVYLKNQDYFYNIVLKAKVKSEPGPFELLGFLKGIEFAFGRKKGTRYGPRIIDIDLLYYGEMFIDSEFLKVPHPGISERKFVLIPLSEIEPDFVIKGMNIKKFIEESLLTEKVNKVKNW